jgi:hypothetical protein
MSSAMLEMEFHTQGKQNRVVVVPRSFDKPNSGLAAAMVLNGVVSTLAATINLQRCQHE